MKIFVTGGAGFIGSHVCLDLLQKGHQVTAYDNLSLGRRELLQACKGLPGFRFVQADLLDFETLLKNLKGHELVYHLAANSDIAQGGTQTDIDLKQGTLATYNVLEAMRHANVRQLIFASTSAIYGEATQKPTPETYGPLLPISFYGASKLACEALCTAFAHNYDMQIWMYRFANIVGGHATHGAIYDFIGRLFKNPDRLEVLGNGRQKKSYLHVEDCVRGMWFGYQKASDPVQVFNLASMGVTEVRFMAESVVREMAKVTGQTAQLKYGESDRGWKGDVPYTHLEGARMSALGWQAAHASDAAVERAIREIVAEQLEARQ